MEEKLKIIELIKAADISKDFWADDILDVIENKYAKGYLTAKLEVLSDSLDDGTEDYREDFLSYLEYNIWE